MSADSATEFVVAVNFDGSLDVTTAVTLSRAKSVAMAHELLHGVMESRGFDATRGVLSDVEDKDYIFVFGEFVMVKSTLTEHGPRVVLQWDDDGFLNEVSGHPDTELWFYRAAQ